MVVAENSPGWTNWQWPSWVVFSLFFVPFVCLQEGKPHHLIITETYWADQIGWDGWLGCWLELHSNRWWNHQIDNFLDDPASFRGCWPRFFSRLELIGERWPVKEAPEQTQMTTLTVTACSGLDDWWALQTRQWKVEDESASCRRFQSWCSRRWPWRWFWWTGPSHNHFQLLLFFFFWESFQLLQLTKTIEPSVLCFVYILVSGFFLLYALIEETTQGLIWRRRIIFPDGDAIIFCVQYDDYQLRICL